VRHQCASCCSGDATGDVPVQVLGVMKASVYHLDTLDVVPIVVVYRHHWRRALCGDMFGSLTGQLSFIGPSCGVDGAAATIGV
jgi:hypothetical protein